MHVYPIIVYALKLENKETAVLDQRNKYEKCFVFVMCKRKLLKEKRDRVGKSFKEISAPFSPIESKKISWRKKKGAL